MNQLLGEPFTLKGQTNSKWFFQGNVSSKKWTNKFNFTTVIPEVDLFSFLFWRKLKTPKSYFETDLYLLQYKKNDRPFKTFAVLQNCASSVTNILWIALDLFRPLCITFLNFKGSSWILTQHIERSKLNYVIVKPTIKLVANVQSNYYSQCESANDRYN